MTINFLLGRSEFNSKSKIINSVRDFDRYTNDEKLDCADSLLVFKSETQQCWLVFTSQRMYFIVDDIEKGILKVLWARDKDNLSTEMEVSLHLKEENYSRETGKLFFGKMNNSILFTKSLFVNKSISGTILSLMKKNFNFEDLRDS